jgi:hypothetical protein
MHFFHFYSCSSNLFCLKPFFGAFFHNFFNGFKISVKFCVFNAFFDFFEKKIFFCHIGTVVLFSNFEAKRAKNGSKNQKTYFVNVSYISILHPSEGLYSLFSKKSQIRCTLLPIQEYPFRSCLPTSILLKR